MLLQPLLALAIVATLVYAAPKPTSKGYRCQSSVNIFTIKADLALAAISAAPTGGFPHAFGGMSGNVINAGGLSTSNTQLKFYGGVNPKCNERNPRLMEYPVMHDGTKYLGRQNGHTLTPARVVFLQDTKELCGVIAHFIESDDHVGSGPFRVCDLE